MTKNDLKQLIREVMEENVSDKILSVSALLTKPELPLFSSSTLNSVVRYLYKKDIHIEPPLNILFMMLNIFFFKFLIKNFFIILRPILYVYQV